MVETISGNRPYLQELHRARQERLQRLYAPRPAKSQPLPASAPSVCAVPITRSREEEAVLQARWIASMAPIPLLLESPWKKKMAAKQLMATVCARYMVLEDDILGSSRQVRLTWPRFLLIFLIFEITGMSLSSIGRFLRRHHASIIHSIRRAREEMEADPIKREEAENIMAMVKASLRG